MAGGDDLVQFVRLKGRLEMSLEEREIDMMVVLGVYELRWPWLLDWWFDWCWWWLGGGSVRRGSERKRERKKDRKRERCDFEFGLG